MKPPVHDAKRVGGIPDPTDRTEITTKHVAGWFQEAIKRRKRPSEEDCIELTEHIRRCARPIGADPPGPAAREFRKMLLNDDPDVRRAIQLVLKAINRRVATIDSILDSGSSEALNYEAEHRSDRSRLEKLGADLHDNAFALCGGLGTGRRSHRDAAWHRRAEDIAWHVRAALKRAGWKRVSLNADAPLVRVTTSALQVTEQRSFTNSTVATALRRKRTEQRKRETPTK